VTWSHQQTVDGLVMQCAWDALAHFSRNPKGGHYLFNHNALAAVFQEHDIVRLSDCQVTFRNRDDHATLACSIPIASTANANSTYFGLMALKSQA